MLRKSGRPVRGRDLTSVAAGVSVATTALICSCAWAQYEPVGRPTSAPGTQGWRLSPALTVSEIYSDNVSLAPSGSATRSELTTRVRPSVTLTENSAQLKFNGTYSPELLYRAQQGTTDVSHYLNALGNVELLSRTLFLEVRGGITHQNVSLLGPQSEGNLNTTQNRTTIKTYAISPYLRHDFGVDALEIGRAHV